MSEGNSITVSVGAKRQAGSYEPVEVRVSYTLALEPNASIDEFNATETILYGEIMAQVEAQVADAVRRLQNGKLDDGSSFAATQEEDRRPTQPPVLPKPVNAPQTPSVANGSAPSGVLVGDGGIAWHRAQYWPKKEAREVGLWWTAKVLEFEKGEFKSKDGGKTYNALVITCEDGRYPKTVKVFHDMPAYPAEGTPYRAFFQEGKYDVRDKGVYAVLGFTGRTYLDALEVVPLAFTTTPDSAASLLPDA